MLRMRRVLLDMEQPRHFLYGGCPRGGAIPITGPTTGKTCECQHANPVCSLSCHVIIIGWVFAVV